MHNKIIDELNKKGFDAYIVGGAVRDILMGKSPKDYDIVTGAKPEEIKDIFKEEKISEVGESFKVVIINGIEVATYRKDRYFGLSDKNVEISYADSIEEDLERRDLTINAIAMHKDKLIDLFGGEEDIKMRTINFVGDPEDRIYEDPCRILRALRFSVLFEDFYNIGNESYKALKENAHLLRYVSKERIRLEILKVMEYKQPSLFFHLLKEFDILQHIFPSLEKGFYHYDGNHHKETLFLHGMIAGDSITSRKPLLRLTGYLHDAGKAIAWNGVNYKGHDKIGAETVKKELEELKFSGDEIKYITNLIEIHMVHLKELSARGMRRLFTRIYDKDINWKDILQLRIADRTGNLKNRNYTKEEVGEVALGIYKELNKEPAFSVKALKIDGHDVMRIIGIPAGPQVGEILNHLFDKIIEDSETNSRMVLLSLLHWNKGKYKERKYDEI